GEDTRRSYQLALELRNATLCVQPCPGRQKESRRCDLDGLQRMGWPGSRLVVVAAVALAAVAGPGWALGDLVGNAVPNTAIGDPPAQLPPPSSAARRLTLPFDGVPADGTGDTGSPEDDLLTALDDLASARDAGAAAKARTLALSILEGDPLPRKPYSGIP